MKKFKGLLVAIFAVILLAGCGMQTSMDMKVTSDKKVNFGMKILMDDEMIDAFLSMQNNSYDTDTTKTYTDAERKAYLEENMCGEESTTLEGSSCKVITEGKYKGVELYAEGIDIEDLTGTGEEVDMGEMMNSGLSEGKFFKKSGDVYSSNMKFTSDSMDSSASDYSSSIDEYTFTFSITLPNKAISNNADKVSSDGLTYTWKIDALDVSTVKDIDFSFSFDGTSDVNNGGSNNGKNGGSNTTGNNGTNNATGNDAKNSDSGMSTTTLVLIIVSSVLGLIVISLLIILFARKSTKKPSHNAVETEASQMFKNPEIAQTSAKKEPEAVPAEPEATKEEPKKEE